MVKVKARLCLDHILDNTYMKDFDDQEVQNDSKPSENRKRALTIEDDNCIICLQHIQDRTILPQCSHDSQCFSCILEWTKHSTKCPLCVSDIGPFIIHNVRSKHDYRRHFISPALSPGALVQSRSLATGRRWANSSISGPSTSHLREEERRRDEMEAAIMRRRHVYNNGLFAKHVAASRYTGYTLHPTPAQVSASMELQGRARAFLRRELRVWINLDVEFLTNYIISLIKMLDLRSESGIKLLADLMDPSISYSEEVRKPNTEHLAHELLSFLRSPFKQVEAYDAVVQYDIAPSLSHVRGRHNLTRDLSPPALQRRDGHHARNRSDHERKHSKSEKGEATRCLSIDSRPVASSLKHSSEPRVPALCTGIQRDFQAPDGPSDSEYCKQTGSAVQDTCQDLAKSVTAGPYNHQAALMHKIRTEMALQREKCTSGDVDSRQGAEPSTPDLLPGLTIASTPGHLTAARREELLARLQNEKSRLGATQTTEANEFDHVPVISPISGSGGFQIRGAAAKARETLEKKLRAQALLRVRLAREKTKLASTRGEVEDGAASAQMVVDAQNDGTLLDASNERATLQHRLQEKLLKERLFLARTKKLNTVSS